MNNILVAVFSNVLLFGKRFLWSPYGIGQTIIFSSCGFFFFYLSFFLA